MVVGNAGRGSNIGWVGMFVLQGVSGLCPTGITALLSRDRLIVARQFIAWYPREKGRRPVGHGMIGSDRRATIRTINQPGLDQTVPFLRRHPGYGGQDGTDSRLNLFQAINCLATISRSLRDGFFSTEFQAMNCLATFIRSLRDES